MATQNTTAAGTKRSNKQAAVAPKPKKQKASIVNNAVLVQSILGGSHTITPAGDMVILLGKIKISAVLRTACVTPGKKGDTYNFQLKNKDICKQNDAVIVFYNNPTKTVVTHLTVLCAKQVYSIDQPKFCWSSSNRVNILENRIDLELEDAAAVLKMQLLEIKANNDPDLKVHLATSKSNFSIKNANRDLISTLFKDNNVHPGTEVYADKIITLGDKEINVKIYTASKNNNKPDCFHIKLVREAIEMADTDIVFLVYINDDEIRTHISVLSGDEVYGNESTSYNWSLSNKPEILKNRIDLSDEQAAEKVKERVVTLMR